MAPTACILLFRHVRVRVRKPCVLWFERGGGGDLCVGGVGRAPLSTVHGAQSQVIEASRLGAPLVIHFCMLHLDHRVAPLHTPNTVQSLKQTLARRTQTDSGCTICVNKTSPLWDAASC